MTSIGEQLVQIARDICTQHPATCRCSEWCRAWADADWSGVMMTERANWDRMDGFARATDPGPELSEAMLEEACERIIEARRGYGFAYHCWRLYFAPDTLFRASLGVDPDQREHVFRQFFDSLQRPQPRMRKEFVPLFEGDTLIGQLTIERPFDARDWLPFVERIHPDDDNRPGFVPTGMVEDRPVRVQRFLLHKGRYRLEGSYADV